jgi:hypothetical protein
MRELDAGRVQSYQERYGVLADQPITDWDFRHSDISEAEFDQAWADARRAREAKPQQAHRNAPRAA